MTVAETGPGATHMVIRFSAVLSVMAGAVLALVACSAPSTGQAPSPASVAAHVDAATQVAGTDLGPLLALCKAPPAVKPSQEEMEHGLSALMAKTPPAPAQAFDNLYYVGADWVSAWALKTSDGIILFDALDNKAEAAGVIEVGLRKLGLDPGQIKYIVVTHGHGDHYGGVPYLAEKYRARVVMSALEWTMTETRLEFDSKQWDAPPKRDPARDLAVADGDSITLGDTKVMLYLTPGHTLGTLSPVFDVMSGGQKHRAMLWGGTAFNFGKNIPRLDSYITATQRMRDVATRDGVDVLISNHAQYDGAFGKLARLRQQGSLQPNPFVLGTPTVDRALNVMGECAQAARDRFQL